MYNYRNTVLPNTFMNITCGILFIPEFISFLLKFTTTICPRRVTQSSSFLLKTFWH